MSPPPAARDALAPVVTTDGVLPTTDVVRGISLYALEAKLEDQTGRSIRFELFRGQPTIVAMFYASCPQACPRLISNIKAIEAALDPAARAKLRVLLISIDPETDDPATLRRVVDRHGLDTARWRLARTDAETMREIAAVLGVKYRRDDGTLNHSSVITVLDQAGAIDSRFDGMSGAALAASDRIRELSRQR
ncbi:MAG: SCO family protein [Polyangiaceae bacterium]